MTIMLFCFLTMPVAYFNVLRIIRRHQQQIQANASHQIFGRPAINLTKYKKTVFIILYILALFSFCFSPYMISIGVFAASQFNSEKQVALSVSLVFLFLSSSLNPGLYIWRMNDIRIGVKQLFCFNR